MRDVVKSTAGLGPAMYFLTYTFMSIAFKMSTKTLVYALYFTLQSLTLPQKRVKMDFENMEHNAINLQEHSHGK